MIHRALLLLAACMAPVAAHGATIAETADQLDRIFENYRLDTHSPGLVYGVVKDGKLVLVKGLGVQDVESRRPVTPDSLFRIASMSKAFTALSVLKLRDEGKISLDAPAETYVPEMRGWTYPTKDAPRIRVRDLLNHSAGFVEDNPWGDRQQPLPEADFTAMLKAGVPFSRDAGLRMEYSNFGYATLGRIVGNVSGLPYADYIRRNLMTPLGMASTGYDIFASPKDRRAIGYRWQDGAWLREPDMAHGTFGAMGGVETSANDYAKWVGFLLSAWPPRDDADTGPVKRATVREIVEGSNFAVGTMRAAAIGGQPCRQAVAYGMAWRVLDDCDLGQVVTHTGGYPGYGSVVILLPEYGVGIFAFANRTYDAPSIAAFRALLALKTAGAIAPRETPVSAGLGNAYDLARSIWRAGDVDGFKGQLAVNFLMDRDVAHWKTEIARVKTDVGACKADEKVRPDSAMEGRFTWICEHGRVEGRVQLAPTKAFAIQALSYTVAQP